MICVLRCEDGSHLEQHAPLNVSHLCISVQGCVTQKKMYLLNVSECSMGWKTDQFYLIKWCYYSPFKIKLK